MKSIKEQRRIIEVCDNRIEMADYLYPDLLDWAERARSYLEFEYGWALEGARLGSPSAKESAVQIEKLLAELPE